MNIINLTPHLLDVHLADGGVLSIESTGNARCPDNRKKLGDIEGIEISTVSHGAVEGLPEPVEGTIYVVSMVVAQKAPREDVFSPGELIRDEKGRPVGCRGLTASTKQTSQVWEVRGLRNSDAGWNYVGEGLYTSEASAKKAADLLSSRSTTADTYRKSYDLLLKKQFITEGLDVYYINTPQHDVCREKVKKILAEEYGEEDWLGIAYFGPSGPAKVVPVEVL